MLAALGLDSVDDLFADIPADLRADGARPAGPEPELELAARCASWPAATGRTSCRSWEPASIATGPAGGRPAAPARRVVHGVHAVPARGQPGHAPDHLRVRVADRRARRHGRGLGVALRRRGGDGRGGADDLPGDAARARAGQPRASTRTTGRPCGRTSAAGWSSRRSRSSRTAMPPGRPTSRPSSGCWPSRTVRSPA